MVQTSNRQQRRRHAAIEEIKATARRQIAENGATSLSLGAIARAMGMTPPALYRYFENRNALVVALILDAYNSLGEAMEKAVMDLPQGDCSGQFLALMRAYRQWAFEHPAEYAIMYGAPAAEFSDEQHQQFQQAVMRSMRTMVQTLRAAHAADRLIIPNQYDDPPSSVRRALGWMQSVLQDEAIPLGVLALTLMTWIHADGFVWQELHGHLPKALFGAGDLYEMESHALAGRLGLTAW